MVWIGCLLLSESLTVYEAGGSVVLNSTVFVLFMLIMSAWSAQYDLRWSSMRWSSAGESATRATSSAYCHMPAYVRHIVVCMCTPS